MKVSNARVRMLVRDIKVRELAKRLGINESRLTKILGLVKGYPPERRELEALARELELSKRNVLADATALVESALEAFDAEARELEATFDAFRQQLPEFRTDQPLPQAAMPVTWIPIIGRVQAGLPILAKQNIEGWIPAHVEGPIDVLKPDGEFFALHVYGDSMEGAEIFEGGTVICKKHHEPKSGLVVAATLLHTQETTLKFFVQRGKVGYLVAQPAPGNVYYPDGRERYPDIEIKYGVVVHGYVVAYQKGAPRYISKLAPGSIEMEEAAKGLFKRVPKKPNK